jgi:poly(ADP-ribose) glycohydrolase
MFQPPPVLRMGSNQSVTMSQQQAACLLACAFFCLFPYRSHHEQSDKYKNFQDPNFSR